MATETLVTANELLRIPDDGLRRELVQGEVRVMIPAGHNHGRIVLNITTPLDQHVRANDLGAVYAAETGFQLATDPDTVRAPDCAFVARERLAEVAEVEGFWPGAPDLAVEVISPGDRFSEVEEKVFDWIGAGTRMVIVVNPRERSVTVYRSRSNITVLTENEKLAGGDVVPGWSIRVKKLFS